jgi:hypothetical protein
MSIAPQPDAPAPATRGRPKLIMFIVTAMFVGPILLAYAMAWGWLPGITAAQVNRGVLVNQAEPLPFTGITLGHLGRRYGEWNLLLLAAPDCPAPCGLQAEAVERFWQALGIEQDRVQVIRMLAPEQSSKVPAEPHVHGLALSPDEQQALTELAAGATLDAVIVDFEGRAVTVYPAPALLTDILKDLRRLLRATKTP